MKGLKPRLVLSVSCPTCGVDPGKRCLLYSGGLRIESHVDRKFAALEADKVRKTRSKKARTKAASPRRSK
jgi:hypothetical protein